MDLWSRLADVQSRWNVLEHPFYTRWSRGELTRDELALYAGQYRHAVVALAGATDAAARAAVGADRAELAAHAGGFLPAREEENVRRAVGRLGIEYPVVIDLQLELWDMYGNEGWPARYLWDEKGALFSMHYGEGAYAETEHEIQELLGTEGDVVPPVRPEDEPGLLLPAQTDEKPGAYRGPYEAGSVWAVLEGKGSVTANGRTIEIDEPGCYPLVEHPHHTAAVLDLEVGPGVTCHATCFTAGVADPRGSGHPGA